MISEYNLKNLNTYRLNSVSRYYKEVETEEELIEITNYLNEKEIKYKVIGNGSNLIFPEYYDGAILKLAFKEINYFEENIIEVGAGVMINFLAKKVSEKGLKGLEWAGSIPGTVGGSTVNNSGAYGTEIFDNIVRIKVLKNGEVITLNKEDIIYEYRHTNLKNSNAIVMKVYFKLEAGDPDELLSLIKERDDARREKKQHLYPSAGSVFRNPPSAYAGELIEKAGLKGLKEGGAQVSEYHANFIFNVDNATPNDIRRLIKTIQKEVKNKNKIDLILEQEIID